MFFLVFTFCFGIQTKYSSGGLSWNGFSPAWSADTFLVMMNVELFSKSIVDLVHRVLSAWAGHRSPPQAREIMGSEYEIVSTFRNMRLLHFHSLSPSPRYSWNTYKSAEWCKRVNNKVFLKPKILKKKKKNCKVHMFHGWAIMTYWLWLSGMKQLF